MRVVSQREVGRKLLGELERCPPPKQTTVGEWEDILRVRSHSS